jgi:hypothetical protein
VEEGRVPVAPLDGTHVLFFFFQQVIMKSLNSGRDRYSHCVVCGDEI